MRIVSNAYKSRVQTAETEIRQLKSQLAERGEQVRGWERVVLFQACLRNGVQTDAFSRSTPEYKHRHKGAVLLCLCLQMTLLQKKYSALEVQLIEQTQRGNQLVEENKQLLATTRKVNATVLPPLTASSFRLGITPKDKQTSA